jgi:hypothetical protein
LGLLLELGVFWSLVAPAELDSFGLVAPPVPSFVELFGWLTPPVLLLFSVGLFSVAPVLLLGLVLMEVPELLSFP